LNRLSALCVAAALGIAASAASAAPVAITNGHVHAGISDYGTLGSNGNNPPGILFDATGSGNFGINDFLTPGSPFEGFYISSNSGFWGANNRGDTSFETAAPVLLSGTSASWTSTSFDGLLRVSHLYTLSTISGRSVISINTQITNLGDSSLDGLKVLRTLDPDPDVNAHDSFFTANTLVSATQACGTGPFTGETICIFGNTPGLETRAGISVNWSTDPDTFLQGVNDGDGDNTIGVAFAAGSLAAGQTLTLNYGYALGASLPVAAVPEPETWALLLAGLAAVGRVARSRRQA